MSSPQWSHDTSPQHMQWPPESPRRGAETYPKHLARAGTHASGEELVRRPIRHDDGEREEAFVRGLSRDSSYNRKLSAIKITPEWIERMTHIDYHCHMAFAVTTMERSIEQFLGVGRYFVAPTKPTAEFALVVADARQGRGLVSCPVNSWHMFCIGFRYLSEWRYRDADGTSESRTRVAAR